MIPVAVVAENRVSAHRYHSAIEKGQVTAGTALLKYARRDNTKIFHTKTAGHTYRLDLLQLLYSNTRDGQPPPHIFSLGRLHCREERTYPANFSSVHSMAVLQNSPAPNLPLLRLQNLFSIPLTNTLCAFTLYSRLTEGLLHSLYMPDS